MARVVVENQSSVIVEPWWAKGKSIYIGLGMGLLWWVLTAILRRYVVEPLACRDLATATACVDSLGVSGAIAAVLVAVAGTFLLVRYLQPRPIIISAAVAVVLWTLGTLVAGLPWYATLFWAVILYAISYGLFSMVARISWLWLSLLVAAVLIVGVRLLLAL